MRERRRIKERVKREKNSSSFGGLKERRRRKPILTERKGPAKRKEKRKEELDGGRGKRTRESKGDKLLSIVIK